ncbi:uncharacterized protein LOC114951472 [Acropora millepora]|uniref:uncharacterized protein LOC114951472 n=1 Tax=Acropora millepora TaxID=45264 RepID=UPI001CF5CF3A|nr:uncharacterized protein LOC114951472 [Acropora millepora]
MAKGSEYTEEQLNYYRICCIATDELTDGLRTIFKQEWDKRYATTLGEWKDEAKNGQDFKNGESPRNQARNQELLATMINGNRAEWDCTMLFYAIQFSDCVGRDLSSVVRSNVDDLRKFRDKVFAHLPPGHISEPKFQSAIAKVQGAFQALGLSTAKIQEIRNQAYFSTSHLKNVFKEVNKLKQEVKDLEDQLWSETTPFCILPPKPSHDIAARNDEVANITQELKRLKETNESRLSYLYISGNPGSGKSQLAGLVAEQIFMESTDTFVMTLSASDLDSLLDSYVSFARHLKCSEYAVTNTLNDKDLKTEEKIAYIKSLAGTKVELYASWLLLVDNVVSIPEMHAHLPDTGNSCWSRGQLLITSQDTTSIPPDNSFIKMMSVSKGMAPSDATSLLATISGIADDETSEKVANALDYQPLALASAATFVKLLCNSKPSSNLGWRDFLEKLHEGQLKYTETFLSNTNASYPDSMTTAIALAVEKSMSSDKVLKHAFNVISLCAPQPLNLDIVTNYIQKAEENGDEITGGEFKDKDLIGLRVRKSSLLLLEQDNGEVYVRIHQVVRHVIKRLVKNHSETKRFEVFHVSILSLNQFIVDRKTDDYTANGFRLLVPHLRFLSKQVEANFKDNDLSEEKNKIFNLKDYLSYFLVFGQICSVYFDLKAAKRFASFALKIIYHESVLDHAYGARAHSLMGRVLFQMGTFEEGKRHFERSLALQLPLVGSEHPSVASSFNNLANVLSDQGDLKQAKEYHERALAIRQQTLGPQHPYVAQSYNNLANVLCDQGDLREAKEYHERALAIRQQTLGPQHPDVATSYDNLATVLGDQASGTEADKTEIQGQEYYEQGSDDDDSRGQTSETREEDLPHEIHKLQLKEEPDKVAIFEGTVTSEGFHLDLNEGAIHLTFPPDTVAEPTDIMVYKWKYGACLPQLTEHEAVVSNVLEISAAPEVGGLKFNSEVKVVLSHSAAGLEGYEVFLKRLKDKEKNEWEETAGCDDIRQVSDFKDDDPCPNNVPFSFPVVRAGITECSSYAVVSRLKLSPKYTITVNGGTFAHPYYPQVTITVPQKAVATETRLSLELKVQEVPQDEFQGHDLFCGPILRVLCSSKATFLEPVTIQLPVSLGNKVVHLPQPSDCRVRIFFLSPAGETKEWVEISDKLENPASFDGKLVTFKVQRFSGYAFLLDWTIIIGAGVVAFGIIAYLSIVILNQPLVANFFAYFDPKERINSRDILFLICCPAHRSKDVKQELEKAGLTSREATSRRDMIPGRDKAFVFVSGGITFASDQDMGGFYLRFDGNTTQKAQLQVCLINDKEHCKVEFRDTPNTTVNMNLLSTLNLNWSSSSTDRQIFSVSSASVAPSEEAPGGCSISTSSRKLKVTLLSIEWGSTKGGLSTINRELAIQLAKYDNVEVCMYLPEFSDKDQKEASDCRVSLLKAEKKPGYDDPIDWLASVPRDHQMDIVIGHGIHLGRQVPHIKESHPECKWVQVVHTDPEELAMFKTYPCPTAKGEKKHDAELELCNRADQVVAIGPKLADTYSRFCGNEKILVITPGIFSAFSHITQDTEERRVFHVLVFGRGDIEDFQLKGYDIAAQAVAELKDEEHPVKLVFVGAPSDKEEQIKEMLLNKGISRNQLIVRSAKEREQLAQEFKEADLVIMPSRTEGFGLSALEALSAGLPVRVCSHSGLGQALQELTFGENVVLNSDDPADWAKEIKAVRRKSRNLRLKEAIELREKYATEYQWERQCRALVQRMLKMVKC